MSETEKEPERQPLIRESTKRIMMRALWRWSLPLIPGPDIYDLIIDLRKSRTTIDEKIDKAVDALKDASRLVGELEQSLEERTEKLNTLGHRSVFVAKLARGCW